MLTQRTCESSIDITSFPILRESFHNFENLLCNHDSVDFFKGYKLGRYPTKKGSFNSLVDCVSLLSQSLSYSIVQGSILLTWLAFPWYRCCCCCGIRCGWFLVLDDTIPNTILNRDRSKQVQHLGIFDRRTPHRRHRSDASLPSHHPQ